MPLVPQNNAPKGAPALYGVGTQENTLLFRERLVKIFKPQEYVTIRNITSSDLYWQSMAQDAETETFSEDGTQRQIYRQAPEMWFIPAGETEVLLGANAYLALDAMYKQYAAESVYRNQGAGDKPGSRNFNFSDASLHNRVIEQAYIGKATPIFNTQPTAEQYKTTQPQVTPTTPTPNSDDQIPLPSTAPNGQPAPEIDTDDSTDTKPAARNWPEPKKETAGAGSNKR